MTKQTVGLLIDSLGTGGAQRQIVNLAIGLKNKGFRPLIIIYSETNYFKDLLAREGIAVSYLKRRHFLDVLFLFNLIRLLRRERIAHLITFLFMPSGYALLSKVFLPRLIVIVSERSFEAKTNRRDKIFPRRLYFLANFITANSKSQTISLENMFPHYHGKIKHISNGVYDQTYIYNPSLKEFVISSIGRVSELKGTKMLISALAILRDSFPHQDFKVYWIGANFDSTEQDLGYYNECCQLIEDSGLTEIWQWTGQITNVREVLAKTNILVHVSAGEGFPNAICEAMSHGIPVVASDVMDHPFIVKHKLNGYLVSSHDTFGLVEALSDFIGLSIDQQFKMSQRAYETALESFSMDNMTNAYIKLLQNG